jgi:hypothetical protein
VFAGTGAITTVTTTATQSVVASGDAGLAVSAGTASVRIAMCVSPHGANTPALLDTSTNGGGAFEIDTVSTTRVSFGANQVGTPGAGTWDVGECVTNLSTTQALDTNDFSTGYAFVSNGAATSQTQVHSARQTR